MVRCTGGAELSVSRSYNAFQALFLIPACHKTSLRVSLRKKANLIIYRFRERGLEVFVLNKSNEWGLPDGELEMSNNPDLIELEPGADKEQAVAVEADWHEIPSLKAMLYEEGSELADKFRDIEKGTFVTIKEALKSHLSKNKVQFLRELRDVIIDRNSVRDL